jgi:Uma2 family endonuclease
VRSEVSRGCAGTPIAEAVAEVVDAMLEPVLDLEDIKPSGLRRLMRVEYDQLIELGAFDGEKIELLRGQLVTMSPIGLPHRRLTVWMTRYLIEHLDHSFEVHPGLSLAASEDSEPEPDMMVVRQDASRTEVTDPLLVMEFSDSSIRKDRKVKLPIYAEAGVPEYWIFDLSASGELVVEVYTEPTPTGYGTRRLYRDGEILQPKHVPIEIAVADVPR